MAFKTIAEMKLIRAKRIAQELRTLEREGVLFMSNPPEAVTRVEYMKRFRRETIYRINNKMPDKNCFKDNASRAGDIIRNGEQSKWWKARTSTHHAGQDNRGIVHHVTKFRKRIAETV